MEIVTWHWLYPLLSRSSTLDIFMHSVMEKSKLPVTMRSFMFVFRVKKTLKKMKRKRRRNKRESVDVLLWNQLSYQISLVVCLKLLIVTANQECEVHAATCWIVHPCLMGQKVLLLTSHVVWQLFFCSVAQAGNEAH